MAKVNENSLSTSLMPTAYVRKVILDSGSSLSTKAVNVVDKSRPTKKVRQKDGTLTYEPPQVQPSTTSSEAQTESLNARIEIVVKDVLIGKEGQQSWLFRESEASMIKLKVIQSANVNLSKYLTNTPYFNKCMMSIPPVYNRFIDYEIKEITLQPEGAARGKLSVAWNEGTGNRIAGIYRNFTFESPTLNPEHLTYFVFCEFHSDQTESQENATHSPVIVERVIDSGRIVKDSYVFRDSADRIWAGPVHYHPSSGWMEGAFHGPHQHGRLTRRALPNLKIHDMRVLRDISRLPINLTPRLSPTSHQKNYFSDLYVARSKEGSAHMVLNFNHLNFMIGESKFGSFLKTSPTDVQRAVLQSSPIVNLEVFRRRVVLRKGLNRVESAAEIKNEFNPLDAPPEKIIVSTTQGAGSSILSKSKYNATGEFYNRFVVISDGGKIPDGYHLFGNIKEVESRTPDFNRTFMITDNDISEITDGIYEYGIRVRIKDGTINFLQEKVGSLGLVATMLQEYHANSERSIHYQRTLQRFTERFWNTYANGPGRLVHPWLGSIVKYIEVLDLVTDVSEAQKADLARTLYAAVNPYSGSPAGILRFIEMVRSLESQVFELAKISKKGHTKNKSSVDQAALDTNLDAENIFSTTFDTNVLKNTGFDYFDTAAVTDEMLQMPKTQFQDRINNELSRYSNNLLTPAEISATAPSLSQEEIGVLTSMSEKYTHIAPAALEVANTKINLLSPNVDPLDYVTATAVIENVIQKPAARSVSVPPDAKALGALTMANQGPSATRLDILNSLTVENARSWGIEVDTIEEITQVQKMVAGRPSGDYLGGDSFFATETQREPENTRLQVTQNQDILSVGSYIARAELTSEALIDKEPISFDLANANNFIDRRIRPDIALRAEGLSTTALTDRLAMLPPQVRLLSLNREHLYGQEDDAQSNGFIYNIGMLRAVEYLSSYKAGSLKRPVWSPITESLLEGMEAPLLCRINRYSDPAIEIGKYSKLNEIPVYNEYFMILPSPTPPTRRPRLQISGAKVIFTRQSGARGFIRSSLSSGPQKTVALQLFRYEAAQRRLGMQTDYALTRVPKAPANRFGKTPGASSIDKGASAAPAAQPMTQAPTAGSNMNMRGASSMTQRRTQTQQRGTARTRGTRSTNTGGTGGY